MCDLKTLIFIYLVFRCNFLYSDIISAHLLSIRDIGDMWRLRRIPKTEKKIHPPQQQLIHPSPISQERQEHLLPYQQTTEQLLSSGCETPKLDLNAPPKMLFCFICNIKRD